MKDIDFDELDRAVNSLINPGTTPAPTADSPVENPIATPTPTPTTPPLAERRSSGRFMDVVHPSSDMRTVAVPARPFEQASEPASVSSPEVPNPVAAWPDPIDMHETAQSQTSTVSPEPAYQAPVNPGDGPAPQESPFLSDAKVEKRPLGAFSNEVHDSEPSAPAVGNTSEPAPINTVPEPTLSEQPNVSDHPIHTDTPLPAELQPGLLSIEANEDSSQLPIASTVPTAVETTGPTSITQQYTEQPSTGDKPTGTVFDTEAYKKPQPSKKKKSGWLIVLWIFLLLVVGAGIGAAVYFFVLPRL